MKSLQLVIVRLRIKILLFNLLVKNFMISHQMFYEMSEGMFEY
jgi:hypothetical protein